MAETVAVPFGRVARGPGGSTILSTSPGEWLVLNAASEASAQRARLLELAEPSAGQELVTVLDLTHGRAVIRLTGTRAAAVLAKLCAIDLSPSATPSGRAFRTSVARLVTDVARHDEQDPAGAITSFLLHCDRSYGQYLWNAVLDAASAG
jgi:heterotetrameric sarcosine oxidase gamma subunit